MSDDLRDAGGPAHPDDADARALATAWDRLDASPDAFRVKLKLYYVLRRGRVVAGADRIGDLHRLLLDPAFDPLPFADAGWRALEAQGRLPTADAAGARAVEGDALTGALLGETRVTVPAAERALCALRRWLLLSGQSGDFPRLADALCRQAARNGGAWPFDEAERARVADGAHPLSPAYLPARPVAVPGDFADPTIAAVAAQYEGWPYPDWERLVVFPEEERAAAVRSLHPVARRAVEDAREILVAGCGTGSEALHLARLAPHARVTAIDLSAASLAQARDRCAGVANIVFRRLDLHAVAVLDTRFDVVASGGVLHHLPDPEAGWSSLLAVLRPGGVMALHLYSRIARLRIHAARRHIADLLDRPVDDDLIRAVRARLIALPVNPVAGSTDFYSLAGTHDLLLHRHEDAFDVARIRRFVERSGLDMLGFVLNGPDRAPYRRENPHDPHVRDYAAIQRAELSNPGLFHGGMYNFWCGKPG